MSWNRGRGAYGRGRGRGGRSSGRGADGSSGRGSGRSSGRSSGRGSSRTPRISFEPTHYVQPKKLDSNKAVPMLRYGPSTNFLVFKEKLKTACLEKIGNLGRIIEDDKY